MACKRSAVRSRLAPPASAHSADAAKYTRSPSSRGLGHRPFTAVTGVQIPLGIPKLLECEKVINLFLLSLDDNKERYFINVTFLIFIKCFLTLLFNN